MSHKNQPAPSDSTEVFSQEKPMDNVTQKWRKEGLIRYTQEVWSKAYKREVSESEALEILFNLRDFVRVSLKVIQARESGHECHNLGAGIVERAERGLFSGCPVEGQSGKGNQERVDCNPRIRRRRVGKARRGKARLQRDVRMGKSPCQAPETQSHPEP